MAKKNYSVDYLLVRGIQHSDRRCAMQLYEKYLPLINRRAHMAYEPEDFKQDAFEKMVKIATERIKLDKIKNPDSWGFYYVFNLELIKTALKTNRLQSQSCHNRAFQPAEAYTGDLILEDEELTTKSGAALDEIFSRYSPHNELLRLRGEDICRELLKTATPKERKLLDLRLKGVNMPKCAKALGISSLNTRYMLMELRRRAELQIRHIV